MDTKQANDAFDKLELMVIEILGQIPFKLINKASAESESLRERMESQIEKLENKKELNEEQEEMLDRFQSTLESIRNIDTMLELLKNVVEDFAEIREALEEAKTTI